MKINTQPNTQLIKSQVKVKEQKKEGLEIPTEQVDIGTEEEIPDFLKKPGTAAVGCGLMGATVAAGVSGTIHGIGGMKDALVGWAGQAIGGPVGGAVAIVGMTSLALYNGLKKPGPDDIGASFKQYVGIKDSPTKKTFKAILSAGTTAVATALGANLGAAGVVYGGLAKGGTYAVVKGAKWGAIGASAGAATGEIVETAEGLNAVADGLEQLSQETEK